MPTMIKTKILNPFLDAVKSAYSLNNSGQGWSVSVNGITIGQISEQDMDTIYRSVRRDKRLWLAQGFQVVKGAVNAAVAALKLTPLTLFGYAVVGAMIEPDKLNQALTTTPAEVFLAGTAISFAFSCFAVFITAMFQRHVFGFRDQFGQERARRIRVLLNEPADGEVSFIDQAYVDHFKHQLKTE
ncbi:hypothetical protein CC202_09440 [Pseudomonas savastanoi]|uniref:hypothetical protein n=1 Tax=Pseudomonas savastanoi TaxID=29438 RepID=UPI000BA3A56A|nr:hypothetical protein [Pseudomonas savastanoi]PAB33102.1 hypothetical protein CC202_09440 [Pseudomonas savastanoi]